VQIVLLRLAVGCIELDRACNHGIAARRPIVAGVELHRLEHVAVHPDVEPFAGHALDDRADDREIEVGVGEIIVAGTVDRVPVFRIGHDRLERHPERDHVIVIMLAHRAGVRQEHA
jgi:hypothetical protein